MHVKKIRAAGVPKGIAETFIGEGGTLFYDHDNGILRISDGHTPGGHLVYGSTLLPNNGTDGQVLAVNSTGTY